VFFCFVFVLTNYS